MHSLFPGTQIQRSVNCNNTDVETGCEDGTSLCSDTSALCFSFIKCDEYDSANNILQVTQVAFHLHP